MPRPHDLLPIDCISKVAHGQQTAVCWFPPEQVANGASLACTLCFFEGRAQMCQMEGRNHGMGTRMLKLEVPTGHQDTTDVSKKQSVD